MKRFHLPICSVEIAMAGKTRYITTDLDIFSNRDLSELAAFFQGVTCILHCGWRSDDIFHLCLEPNSDSENKLGEDLENLLSAVEQLPGELSTLWRSASEVDFNIGVETGDCHGHNMKVSAKHLERIARLNGTLSITTYPAE
ncbi:hypothetical protein ACQKP8_22860 [Photobacterium alginatilyticum]|uniref:hypothetical protein n=1 Tax=Photobacterium alginatilyticum TaxID=1775171 RepID=UPI0040676B8C